MALVPCRECGKQISDDADSCPYCGYIPERARGYQQSFIILAITVAIAFLAFPGFRSMLRRLLFWD